MSFIFLFSFLPLLRSNFRYSSKPLCILGNLCPLWIDCDLSPPARRVCYHRSKGIFILSSLRTLNCISLTCVEVFASCNHAHFILSRFQLGDSMCIVFLFLSLSLFLFLSFSAIDSVCEDHDWFFLWLGGHFLICLTFVAFCTLLETRQLFTSVK